MLFHYPPHQARVLRPTVSRDSGGGILTSYAVLATGLYVSINTLSSGPEERLGTEVTRVTHVVAFLSASLTVPIQPGDIFETEDTGHRFRIIGMRRGRAYGSIPALTYCDCEQML